MFSKHPPIIILLLLIVTCGVAATWAGCSRSGADPRLDKAESLVECYPDSALSILDGVNVSELSETDRRSYNLLRIKAADKAFINHLSELLINDALPERGNIKPSYFSEIGYTSLLRKHFRDFYARIENNDDIADSIKSRILKEMTVRLVEVKEYGVADEFLSKAIEIERHSGDTLTMAADLRLSAGIRLRSGNPVTAERAVVEAYDIDRDEESLVYLAAVKFSQDSVDAALNILNALSRPTRESGIYQALRDFFHIHVAEHAKTSRDLLYLAIIRRASYGYLSEADAKMAAENRNMRLSLVVSSIIVVVLILVVIIIYLRYRHKCTVLELRRAIESLEAISATIQNDAAGRDMAGEEEMTVEEMRVDLRQKLLDLYNESDRITISPKILNSQAYDRLSTYIDCRKEIKPDDEFWNEIEAAVLEASPLFKKNLQILLRGNLVSYDLPTALLIKCGVTPGQMVFLLNREKGTISSRRRSLSQRIFDQKLGTKIIDGIIRLL